MRPAGPPWACSNCGARIPAGDKRCAYCGNKAPAVILGMPGAGGVIVLTLLILAVPPTLVGTCNVVQIKPGEDNAIAGGLAFFFFAVAALLVLLAGLVAAFVFLRRRFWG